MVGHETYVISLSLPDITAARGSRYNITQGARVLHVALWLRQSSGQKTAKDMLAATQCAGNLRDRRHQTRLEWWREGTVVILRAAVASRALEI